MQNELNPHPKKEGGILQDDENNPPGNRCFSLEHCNLINFFPVSIVTLFSVVSHLE